MLFIYIAFDISKKDYLYSGNKEMCMISDKGTTMCLLHWVG